MNERQLGTQAVSIVIDLYLDILRGIPDLLNILDESKASSYYGETVSKEIHYPILCCTFRIPNTHLYNLLSV